MCPSPLRALLAALLATLVLAAPAAAFNWRQHEGTTLNVLFLQWAWTKVAEPHLAEFEKLTGIKLVVEKYPETQGRQKLAILFGANSDKPDIFHMIPTFEGLKAKRAGSVEPLDAFLKAPGKLAPNFDLADFIESALGVQTVEGKLVGLPIKTETATLFYRKDLFEKYGVKPPTTLDELEEAARRLTLDEDKDGKPEIYGITMRGKGNPAVYTFATFLHNMGGAWLNDKREPIYNSPAGARALDLYARLLRKYGPPGQANYHWKEAQALFAQGKAAMIYDANSFMETFADPKQSKVVGKIGISLLPAGPAGSHPAMITQGVSINARSKNKDAAWLFVQWAVNKELCEIEHLRGVASPRRATWKTAADKKADPEWHEWARVSLEGIQKGTPTVNPHVVAVPEVRDSIGKAIVDAILGKDPKQSLDQSVEEVRQILKKTEG